MNWYMAALAIALGIFVANLANMLVMAGVRQWTLKKMQRQMAEQAQALQDEFEQKHGGLGDELESLRDEGVI